MWCDVNAMGFFGWTTMIVFWVAVVVLLVWGIRAAQISGSGTRPDALDVLERRLAAGEIDPAEFEERRELLEDDRHTRQ